jgi:hypothetical protein
LDLGAVRGGDDEQVFHAGVDPDDSMARAAGVGGRALFATIT